MEAPLNISFCSPEVEQFGFTTFSSQDKHEQFECGSDSGSMSTTVLYREYMLELKSLEFPDSPVDGVPRDLDYPGRFI